MDTQIQSEVLDAMANAAGFLMLNENDESVGDQSADLLQPVPMGLLSAAAIDRPDVETKNDANYPLKTDVNLDFDLKQEQDPWLGIMVNGYRLLAKVGQGGGGIVYRALQTEPVRRIVAIKFLNTGATHNPRRLEVEKRTLLELDHPHIVTILDAGNWDKKIPYIVMKYINGIRADEWAETSKASVRDIAGLMLQVARTMAYAHSRGIIHRDLKPGNLLVVKDRHFDESVDDAYQKIEIENPTQNRLKPSPSSPQGIRQRGFGRLASGAYSRQTGTFDRPDRWQQPSPPDFYVTDFGLAKILTQDLDVSATDTATVLGSRGYLSPEQARVDPALLDQPAVDVYGFGATLYRLLTGLTPVRTETWDICLDDLKHRDPESTRLFNPDVPRDLDAICLKCLEKNPNQRYSSMDELAADLQRFLAGQPVSARPLSAVGKLIRKARRQPVLFSLGATLLVGLIGSVITFGTLWQQTVISRRQVSHNLEVALKILKDEQEDAESLLKRVPGVMEYRIRRLDAAIGLLRQIVAENPHDTFPKRRLAVALYLRGKIPLHEGRLEQRQQDFLEAKRIFEELYTLNPADHTLQFDVFHCLLAYSYTIETPEQRIENEYHQQALIVIEDLATRFPDNDVYQDAYAAALCQMSEIYTHDQFNQFEYAVALAEQALTIAKRNVARHPDKPRYLRHIVGASCLLAKLSHSFPEYLWDITYLYDALDAARQLDAAEPDEPMNLMLLASAHSLIALLELRRGNRNLADDHQAAAIEVLESACQTFPDYTAIRLLLREISVSFEQELFELDQNPDETAASNRSERQREPQ